MHHRYKYVPERKVMLQLYVSSGRRISDDEILRTISQNKKFDVKGNHAYMVWFLFVAAADR